MKILCTVLCSLLIVNHLVAQRWDKDSLLTLLKTERVDTTRVQHLLALSNVYEFNSAPDSALLAAYHGWELSQSINYAEGEMECSSRISWISWNRGDYYTSIRFGYPVFNYTQAMYDTASWIEANALLVNSYRDQGDIQEALQMQKNIMPAILAWHNCGNCGISYAVLGSLYYGLEQYDSALFYLQKGLSYPKNSRFYGWELMMVGQTLAKMNSDELAFQYLRQSIQPLIDKPNLKDLTSAYAYLSSLYLKTGQRDSAIFYGKQAVSVGKPNGFSKELLQGYLALSQAYEQVDKTEALTYLKLATELKDEIYGQDKQKQITSLKFNEILRRNEISAARVDADNRLKLNALLGSTFTLAAIAFLLFRNSRNKQKAKQKIEEAFNQLKSTQFQLIHSEKMASLGELTAGIAHEIQNPLNFVNNFSEVNGELVNELENAASNGNLDEVKSLAKDIKENEAKIAHHGKRADGIVKSMLQHSRTSGGQKEQIDINALCDEYLRLSYHGLRAKDNSFNAKFETHFDPSLPKAHVVPQDIGRVLLNLINNAFYAVNEKLKNENGNYDTLVKVTTKNLGDKIEISVKDNGNGIPDRIKEKIFQPFFTTKPTGQGTGLGLSLSYDIVKAHGGTIELGTKVGEGTLFIIQLPY